MNDGINYQEITELYPLISAWGTAVENGRSGAQELSQLQTASLLNPDLLNSAVYLAQAWQKAQIKNAVPIDPVDPDPAHPLIRFERLETLKQHLGIKSLELQAY